MTLPQGIDLTPLLPTIITAVTGLIAALAAWAASAVRRKVAADSAQDRLLRVVESISGKAWDRLAPQVQAALADGKLTPEERAAIEKTAYAVALEVVGKDTLEEVARALRLPLPGVVASIATYLIATFTRAHDPDLTDTESPLAYPVGEAWKTNPQEADSAIQGG